MVKDKIKDNFRFFSPKVEEKWLEVRRYLLYEDFGFLVKSLKGQEKDAILKRKALGIRYGSKSLLQARQNFHLKWWKYLVISV